MEFEEIRKVWDTQNNKPMYVINESVLHEKVASKKSKGVRITNLSELTTIIVNIGVGVFVLLINLINTKHNLFLYLLSAWLIMSGVYCLYSRIRRQMGDKQFDRSMLGDLNYAVSIASYQVRFSALIRWNVIPVTLLSALSLWETSLLWVLIALVAFMTLAYFGSNWEHNYYKRHLRDVEQLRKLLLEGNEM